MVLGSGAYWDGALLWNSCCTQSTPLPLSAGRAGSSRPGSAAEAEKPYSTLKEIEDASHKARGILLCRGLAHTMRVLATHKAMSERMRGVFSRSAVSLSHEFFSS